MVSAAATRGSASLPRAARRTSTRPGRAQYPRSRPASTRCRSGASSCSWTADSPMPVVRRMRQTNSPDGGSTRRSKGSTDSANIGCNSTGGPGSITSQLARSPARKGLGRTSIASPGAVPCGLGRTIAPAGTSACTRFRAGISRRRHSKKCRMCARTAASSCSALPSNCAIKSRVRSSEVGPSPPVVITRSARASASPTAWRMSGPVSGTATWRLTVYP